jgi:hypothetical protein
MDQFRVAAYLDLINADHRRGAHRIRPTRRRLRLCPARRRRRRPGPPSRPPRRRRPGHRQQAR